MRSRTACAAIVVSLLAAVAHGDPTDKTADRSSRSRSASDSIAEKLREPARIELVDGERTTIGNVLDQIRERHGIRVHLYRGTATLMSMTIRESVGGNDHIAGSLHQKTTKTALAVSRPVGTGVVPVSALELPYSVNANPVSAAQDADEASDAAPSPSPVNGGSTAQPVSPAYESPAGSIPETLPEPVSPSSIDPGTPSVDRYPTETDAPEEPQELGDVTSGVHALGACEELFRRSQIMTTTLRSDDITIEGLLRQILAQISTPFDLDEEMAAFPATYTHAYDWDLLVDEDCVYITTRLQANLHKVARVYRIPAECEISADELGTVVRRTIRPWSWREQIDDVVGRVEIVLPPDAVLPKIPQIEKIDLTGSGDLVQFASAEESVDGSKDQQDDVGVDPGAGWQSVKALGSLLSSGTIAFAHALINTTEMLHYADPPTATIEVLPGMLVISQSQGAHREIADLLEQIVGH